MTGGSRFVVLTWCTKFTACVMMELISAMCFFFQWLETTFLGYFREWKKEIQSLPLEANEKQRMLISRETMDGLEITGTKLL